ncbi:MAG: hypothetical protein ACI9G1_002204, partial [Pirellulaceae bacterium]
MAFVNLSLLAGALLVSVPIIIHLVMRQEPQKLMFPALRFLLARKETNRRKLQLRHWILLFLRAAAIGVLALTLARPSVAAAVVGDWIVVAGVGVLFVGLAALAGISYWQDRGRAFVFGFAAASGVLAAIFIWLLASAIGAGGDGLIGDPDAPVAAVFVIDNAPRMEYRSENKTRLEKAKDDALWLLKRLPKGSEVAVVDARPGSAVFSVDLGAAESAVDRLKWTAVPRAMVEMLDNAFKLVSKKVDLRKEIYILSDLSKVAWTEKVDPTLAKRLTESEDIAVYVIDVGVREIQNVALGDLELSAQSIPKNSDLILNTTVRRNGPETERKIQVYIESQDPTRPFIENGELKLPDTELRNERIVKLADGDSQVLQIQLSGLGIGVHHGWIEVVGEDGLAIDDRRYFSIDVSDAWPILVVAPPDVYWQAYTEAIAPYEFRKTERTRFECVVVEPADLANQNFEDYAAICLLDPTPMPPTTWERFGRYVREGGSMGIFLGHHAIQSSSFNQPAAQQLLPGRIERRWRTTERDLFIAPRSLDHPVMSVFRDFATATPWNHFPVYRHWILGDLAENADVVVSFSNGKPALIDRAVGKGQVLTMTTPVSDSLRPAGRSTWNEIPTGQDPWPYFVLANE